MLEHGSDTLTLMTHRPQRTLIVLAAFAVAAGLAGCDYFPPDPISLTIRDGAVVARLCVDVEADRVAVLRLDGKADDYLDSIVATGGPVVFPAGTEVTVGTAPEGLNLLTEHGDYDPTRGEYNFEMYYEAARNDADRWPIDAFYDAADLRVGEWLDGYGERQDEPCTPAPCIQGAACIGQWTPQPSTPPVSSSREPDGQ